MANEFEIKVATVNVIAMPGADGATVVEVQSSRILMPTGEVLEQNQTVTVFAEGDAGVYATARMAANGYARAVVTFLRADGYDVQNVRRFYGRS